MSRDEPLSKAYALSRIGLGGLITMAPRAVGRSWLGESASTPAISVALRGLGVRDVVVGAALLAALDDPVRRKRLLLLSAAVDATDLVTSLGALRSIGGRRPLLGALGAASGVAMGLLAARRA